MFLKYNGSEKGLKLTPKGVDHYSDLLSKTALTLSSEEKADPERIVISVSDRQELLNGGLAVEVSISEALIDFFQDKDLKLAVIVKESASRSSRIAYRDSFDQAVSLGRLEIAEEIFKGLAFMSSIYIDVLVYEVTTEYGYLVQALKRFSLSFSAVAGLWSIEAVEPQFFINRGGGKDTMFITIMDYEGEEDLTMKPAIDVVKVYLNKDCVREFERLTNKSDSSGDVIRRFFVHSIILKIAQQLLTACVTYPKKADDGSVASKMLEILNIDTESSYLSLQQEALRDPETLSLRIQHRLSLSSAIAKYTGGK
jgi:precorrin-2 methylase